MPVMKRRTLLQSISAAAFVTPPVWAAMITSAESKGRTNSGPEVTPGTVYELRVYHAAAAKLAELLARFRDHTIELFARHGMKLVAFWTPADEPQKDEMLIYILEHPNREAAKANWKAFQDDAEWKSVKEKSEANGKLVEKVDSTYMELTDFSPRLK
jgi:NIPSNAP